MTVTAPPSNFAFLHAHDEQLVRLGLLADENRPISSRFDEALGSVHGLGKGTATAVLQIMFPDKYGVWNGTAQAGLAKLDLLPQRKGHTDGEYYAEINDVFGQLSRRMGVDLWTLDALWYYMVKG